jgi:hypothetical protein
MKNKDFTKFPSRFDYQHIENKLSDLKPLCAYSFTKRNNVYEFENLLQLLPEGYVLKQQKNIESIDIVYSGSYVDPFLLTLAVGRNDRFKGAEKFDIDVLNIAPESSSSDFYFAQLWHHFKDDNGNRVSYDISPFLVEDELKKKELTYNVFLTGSCWYDSFKHYETEKPDFLRLHTKSFSEL